MADVAMPPQTGAPHGENCLGSACEEAHAATDATDLHAVFRTYGLNASLCTEVRHAAAQMKDTSVVPRP
jgi:hypothetical protein